MSRDVPLRGSPEASRPGILERCAENDVAVVNTALRTLASYSYDEAGTVLGAAITREVRDARAALRRLRDLVPTVRHDFVGRLDRDCEVCGKPDRNVVHAP